MNMDREPGKRVDTTTSLAPRYDQFFLRFFSLKEDLRVSARPNPFMLPFSSSVLVLLVESRLWLHGKTRGLRAITY